MSEQKLGLIFDEGFIFVPVGTIGPVDVVSLEKEEDGRWLASVSLVPGVMAYGETQDEARCAVTLLLTQTLLNERVSFDAAVERRVEAEQRYVESDVRLSRLAQEIAEIAGAKDRPTHDARADFIRDAFQSYFEKARDDWKRPINLDPALARRIEDLEEAVEDAESGNRSLLARLEESKKELEEARERFGREMHIGAYLAFRHCGKTQEEARYELKKIEAKRQQLIRTAEANIRVLTGTQIIEALDDKAEAL